MDCICHDLDKWECWSKRYGQPAWACEEIREDGGPCDCACHDGEDED